VTEKRGSFKSWTVLMAILAFSLSLLGTFLVRSGVLSSVHAFATDPRRGLFILGFLVVVIGSSLTLYAWRAAKVGLGARFALVSKETSLLINNVLLVVATAAVLLGTLYPLLLDALGLGKISVGPPYFDAVFVPLMAPAVFLMGIGPLARWKEASLTELALRLRWAALATVLAVVATVALLGKGSAMSILGLLMGYWVVASMSVDVWERVRPQGAGLGGMLTKFGQMPRSMVGMLVAHLGVAIFAFGVTGVRTHETERDVQMAVGDSTTVNGYTFTFKGAREVQGPNYTAAQGLVAVTRDGKPVLELRPEKRVYRVQQNPMTEADINAGLLRDLYVSLGEPVEGTNGAAWIVRIYVKPLVNWIWGGCLLMALGGALALSDRRYRRASRREAEQTAIIGAAA
jgi:cytochrome c-type biogenesis protein CcmF